MMRSNRQTIDMEVTVRRDELLTRLQQNRDKHAAEFNQAIAAWQLELATVLQQTDAATSREFPAELERLREECPVSHVVEYERALDMFGMCVNEEIKLDNEAFNTFCRDEWDWKTSLAGNRFYRNVGVFVSH